MAEDTEALTQLARLLRLAKVSSAVPGEMQIAIEQRFEVLIEGLVAEAAASDDVLDRESASLFLQDRLRFLRSVLTVEQSQRLTEALARRIESW